MVKFKRQKELTKIVSILRKTKSDPDILFNLLRNVIGGTIHDKTRDGDKFIIEHVIPYFLEDLKNMQYIYDSIQPIMIKQMGSVLRHLNCDYTASIYKTNYKHIILLNMCIIKKYKLHNYVITNDDLNIIDSQIYIRFPNFFMPIILLYKYQLGYKNMFKFKRLDNRIFI